MKHNITAFMAVMKLMRWCRMQRILVLFKEPKKPPFQSSSSMINLSMMFRWRVWIWEGGKIRNRFKLTSYRTGSLKTYSMNKSQPALSRKIVMLEVRILRWRPEALIKFSNRILIWQDKLIYWVLKVCIWARHNRVACQQTTHSRPRLSHIPCPKIKRQTKV